MTGNYSVWEGVIAPALYLPVTPLADLQNPSPHDPQGMGQAKARFSQWLGRNPLSSVFGWMLWYQEGAGKKLREKNQIVPSFVILKEIEIRLKFE